jgi:hypothetical protein
MGIEIGARRFLVVTDIDSGEPFVCRAVCTHVSPKGKSIKWKMMDIEGHPIWNSRDEYSYSESPLGAIRSFQRALLTRGMWRHSDEERDADIRRIILAERLIEHCTKAIANGNTGPTD